MKKKIYDLAKIIDIKEKDLNESQLDFSYLTSPAVIEKKKALRQKSISAYGVFENILKYVEFLNLQNKFVTQENKNEKKKKKNKIFNENQTSFYFEDFLETNKKNKNIQKNNFFHDRIYLLFFLFFSLILIFSIRIINISLNKIEVFHQNNISKKFSLLRRDIVDRNGVLISRNVKSFHAAINPSLIKDKDKFLIKLRLNFPSLEIKKIKEKIFKGKYFYLKKRITQIEKEKLWSLGEKAIIFEPFQSRIYTHANLFSHIIGQVDYDNVGVSGSKNILIKN